MPSMREIRDELEKKENRPLYELVDVIAHNHAIADTELDLLVNAYHLATYGHHGTKARKSGAKYISHVRKAAKMAAEHGATARQVAKILCHDLLEKGKINGEAITYRHLVGFVGRDIADSVAANSISYWDGKTERFMLPHEPGYRSGKTYLLTGSPRKRFRRFWERELNLQKRSASDHDALISKFYDSLHNMQTARHMPKEQAVKFYIKYKSRLAWMRVAARNHEFLKDKVQEYEATFREMEDRLINQGKIAIKHVRIPVPYHKQPAVLRARAIALLQIHKLPFAVE